MTDPEILSLLRRAAVEIESLRAETKRCLYCGKTITVPKTSRHRKYCPDTDCRARHYYLKQISS
jgi:hypothetical protein